MPKKVYNNVEDYRVLDNGRVCEDVTSFTPPNFSHPTSTMDAAGMAMAVDVPDETRLEAMELTIAHNNGVNCHQLASPGMHKLEFRTVRQRYNVVQGEMEHESVKVRATVKHKSTERGSVERGNPLGYTEKFSVFRYEEEFDGETVLLVDATTGQQIVNGIDVNSPVAAMLD